MVQRLTVELLIRLKVGDVVRHRQKSQMVLIIDDVISASAAERSCRQTRTQHPVSAPG